MLQGYSTNTVPRINAPILHNYRGVRDARVIPQVWEVHRSRPPWAIWPAHIRHIM